VVLCGFTGWTGVWRQPVEVHRIDRRDHPLQITDLNAPEHARRFQRFESTAAITPVPANPFDPAQIDVEGVFKKHGHTYQVPGFLYQDYRRRLVHGHESLKPRGGPVWKVRFAPPAVGTWTWHWEVRTPQGTVRTRSRPLTVGPSRGPGYLRRSTKDPRYLVFDDGSPYLGVGENVGWYDQRGTFAYDQWYARLAAHDANYARLLMTSWSFGIEWNDTGLGNYRNRLSRAWQLDRVVQDGEHRGIYQVISLLTQVEFSTVFSSRWADNPYNVANGGPLASPTEFFTNARAKELFAQRLRYIVARWGYSTHVLAWEFWNEVDLTDGYDSATVATWTREMSDELHRLDVASHLITTSTLAADDPAILSESDLDYTQIHFYARNAAAQPATGANLARLVTALTGERRRANGRPVLFAELGVDSRDPSETRRADPSGIGIHDGLWAGALSGGLGTAMTWWWDNLINTDPNRYYPMFGSISHFLKSVRWDREGFTTPAASVDSKSRPLVVYGLAGRQTILVWVKDDAYQWYSPKRVDVRDASITIDHLAPGKWCGTWWDTWAGRPVGKKWTVAGGRGVVTRTAPSFVGDVALRLDHSGCQRSRG